MIMMQYLCQFDSQANYIDITRLEFHILVSFRYLIQKNDFGFNLLDIKESFLSTISFNYFCAYKIIIKKFYVKYQEQKA